jgi:hypothetical protein
MKLGVQPISNQRLDRYLRWSRLWLLRLAAFIVQTAGLFAPLERAVQTALKPRIDILAQIIILAISLKARRLIATPPPAKPHRPGKRPPHMMRMIIGSRLRRLARAKHLGARISALLALLQNAEAEIARLAKRMRLGLTRRRGGVKRESKMQIVYEALFCIALCADTS